MAQDVTSICAAPLQRCAAAAASLPVTVWLVLRRSVGQAGNIHETGTTLFRPVWCHLFRPVLVVRLVVPF